MTTSQVPEIPLSRVMASVRSVVPGPRTSEESTTCDCSACFEARARARAAEDWRRLREGDAR
jgi:hypothetical protein